MDRRIAIAAALALALVSAAACGGSSVTAPTPTITDTITGTVTLNGADVHNFTVVKTGDVTITVTALAPTSTISMGIALGQPSGTQCAVFSSNTVTQGSVLQGSLTAGTYCLGVYDIGNVTSDSDISYTLTVLHP